MTDEQILQLVKEYFRESCIHDSSYSEWFGDTDAFVKFARELYDKAKWEGYYDGYEMCSIDMGGEE